MEVVEPQHVIHDIFEYRRIEWKVTNFPAGSCVGDGFVWSPEFCVRSPFETKWRLCLAMIPERYGYAFVYLERLKNEPFLERVRVNCRVGFPGRKPKEVKFLFEAEDVCRMFVKMCDSKYSTLMEAGSCIALKSYIIVYREDYLNIFNFYAEGCLKSLSQDMYILNSQEKDSDTDLYSGSGDTLKVHRAILCRRNRVFSEMVARAPVKKVVDLNYPHKERAAVQSLIGFLYSGNLKYVLRVPSFSIEKVIRHFQAEELEPYYKYDELRLESGCQVREESSEWVVQGPELEKHSVSTGFLKGLTDGHVYRLHLYPRGLGKRKDYASLQIEIDESQQPRGFCMYFGVKDINNQIHHLRFSRWLPADGVLITIKLFALRTRLRQHYIVAADGTEELKLHFKMQIAGDSFATKFKEFHPAVDKVDKYKHYVKFSQHMKSLFDGGRYGDIRVKLGIFRFSLHRMILRCRSDVLRKLPENAIEHTVDVTDCFIFFKMLQYMYTGTIRTNSFGEVLKVYRYAYEWGVLALKNACSRMLLAYLNVENAADVLFQANACKDLKLRYETAEFISLHSAEIETQPNWRELKEQRPDLIRDLLDLTSSEGDESNEGEILQQLAG